MGHAILKLTGTPSLAEMEPMGLDGLPDVLMVQNAFEMRRLPEFGLGFYRHDTSRTIWLGLADPAVHDHDRWFLCINPGEEDQWYQVMLDAQRSGRAIEIGDLRLKIGYPNRDHIRDLVARLHHAHLMYGEAALMQGRPQVDRPRATAYTRLLNGVKHNDIALVGTEFELHELHELLYHYDAWVAAHPEAAGVPRELVMRMHKLGFYGRYEGMSPLVRS